MPARVTHAFFRRSLVAVLALCMAGCAGAPSDFDALWDYDHPDVSERNFRQLLPAARRSGNADRLAQLLTQIARTQSLQGNFDEAHRILDEVDGLLTEDLETARIRSLLERGRTFNSSGRPELARGLFVEAWDRARSTGLDALAVDAAHMVAIVEPPEEAIRWNERAISVAQASEIPAAREWLGSLFNNLGWAHHDREDYESALVTFQRAVAWEREAGRGEELRIARWSVARTLRSLGRFDPALVIQRELFEELEREGSRDGFVFEELGECLWALGRHEEARPLFASAYRELSHDPQIRTTDPVRLRRLRVLGDTAEVAAEPTR